MQVSFINESVYLELLKVWPGLWRSAVTDGSNKLRVVGSEMQKVFKSD